MGDIAFLEAISKIVLKLDVNSVAREMPSGEEKITFFGDDFIKISWKSDPGQVLTAANPLALHRPRNPRGLA